MDIQRAIAKINQKARYVLNHSQADGRQKIIFWRGPGPEPTAQELEYAWDDCLEDDANAYLEEQKRLVALVRVKADPVMADMVKVLKL